MSMTQLKADLSMILAAAKRDVEVSDPVKMHFGEIVAWCEAHADQTKAIEDRLESAEAALDEILDGAGEMLSPESAATINSANEHGQLLCQATLALIEGPLAKAIDAVSRKRFQQLIENAQRAFALSTQVVAELTAEDEGDDDQDDEDEDDQEDDDGLGDGLGDGDAGAEASGETEEAGE